MNRFWARFQDFFSQTMESRTDLKKGRFPVTVT
jgi:hypothetical protein